MNEAVLILANGKVFKGQSFGAAGIATGEVVFTTGMTGYIETLTDPSYYGQLVTQTFPLIGNYGFIDSDIESNGPHLTAYIVRNLCDTPSNFRCGCTLNDYLKKHNIIGLMGIDTRALTKIIRSSGVMNGVIASSEYATELLNRDRGALLSSLASFKVVDAVKNVSCASNTLLQTVNNESGDRYAQGVRSNATPPCNSPRLVLWDFGAKGNIARSLIKRGCTVECVPYNTTCEKILSKNPAGVLLSNGPGDPAENTTVIEEIKKLMSHNIALFGICLGHQLMARAAGAKTIKLKYGHRGANHSVLDTRSHRVYITSQNHGYAVDSNTLSPNMFVSFINTNDGTCEGITYNDKPFFSVQFHPEAASGPLDTNFLFDDFIKILGGRDAK